MIAAHKAWTRNWRARQEPRTGSVLKDLLLLTMFQQLGPPLKDFPAFKIVPQARNQASVQNMSNISNSDLLPILLSLHSLHQSNSNWSRQDTSEYVSSSPRSTCLSLSEPSGGQAGAHTHVNAHSCLPG